VHSLWVTRSAGYHSIPSLIFLGLSLYQFIADDHLQCRVDWPRARLNLITLEMRTMVWRETSRQLVGDNGTAL
jgi:hypothetical protein